jgi:hypothetical protein
VLTRMGQRDRDSSLPFFLYPRVLLGLPASTPFSRSDLPFFPGLARAFRCSLSLARSVCCAISFFLISFVMFAHTGFCFFLRSSAFVSICLTIQSVRVIASSSLWHCSVRSSPWLQVYPDLLKTVYQCTIWPVPVSSNPNTNSLLLTRAGLQKEQSLQYPCFPQPAGLAIQKSRSYTASGP